MQILAVHEKIGVLNILRKSIQLNLGYEVLTLRSGQEALQILQKRQKIKESQFNVIISHMRLRDINADEFLRKIKEINSNIDVVFITAYYGGAEMAIDLLKRGAYDYRLVHIENFETEIEFVVKKIIKERKLKEMLKKIGAKEQEVTILFADLEGFTKYANENRDRPEEVGYELNEYLSCMSETVIASDGDIDKYLGDGILVVFRDVKTDNTNENQIVRSIGAAINIQKKLEGGKFDINIGIDTGKVLAGVFGSERRKEYTVIGTPVNFASRLQDEAKGDQILVSEKVFEKLGGIGDSFTITLKIEGEKITCQIKKLKKKKYIKGFGKVWIYEITNY